MSDAWRRVAVQSALVRGTVMRRGQDFWGEVDPGRVVDSAVFECAPCHRTHPARGVRLHVQARVGVGIRTRRRRYAPSGQPGDLQDLLWPDYIAIGARGGHSDQHYLWVQIFSDEPETLTTFGGRTFSEDVGQDDERSRAGYDDNDFKWAHRVWSIDNNQTQSARYALAQPTLGSENCETLYDHPTAELSLTRVMRERPDLRRIVKMVRFHAFLIAIPVLVHERRSLWPENVQPTASVAWSFEEVVSRQNEQSSPALEGQRYTVHYIHPNGILPAGMRRVMRRVFHGR